MRGLTVSFLLLMGAIPSLFASFLAERYGHVRGLLHVLRSYPTLFARAGLPAETASFIAFGVSGVLMFAVSAPAFLLADQWGRRTIVLWGGVLLAGCMANIVGSYSSDSVLSGHGAGRWVVITLILVFA